jgi:hypothetical protein
MIITFLTAVIISYMIAYFIGFIVIPFLNGFFEKEVKYLKKTLKL